MIRKDDKHHQKSKYTGADNFRDSRQAHAPDLSLCLWLWSLECQMKERQARCSGMSRQEEVVLCWPGWAHRTSRDWLPLREAAGVGEQQAYSSPGTSTWFLCHHPNLNSSTPTASKSPGEAAGSGLGHCHVVEGGEGVLREVSPSDFTADDTGWLAKQRKMRGVRCKSGVHVAHTPTPQM